MKKLSLRKKLERELKEALPPIIEKLKNSESSLKEELAVLLLPYVKVVIKKFQKSIESVDSLAGWITFRIISKVHKIDSSKSILGYIVSSATNYCLDQVRHSSRKKRLPAAAYVGIEYVKDIQSVSPTSDSIRFLIESSFNESDSEILISYIEGLTIPQISVLTGQSEDYVLETVQTASNYL